MKEIYGLKNNSDSTGNWIISNLKAIFYFLNCLRNENFNSILLKVFDFYVCLIKKLYLA